MTTPVAGWYADPNGGSDLRYWDGTAWTPSTQPGSPVGYPQPGQPQPYGAQPGGPGYLMAGVPPQAPIAPTRGLLAQSRLTLITVAICIVYLVIARYSHFALFGILPVLMTVRSFQAKEPLAAVAAIVCAATIAYSVYQIA